LGGGAVVFASSADAIDNTARLAIERGYKLAVAVLFEKLGPSVLLKVSDISKAGARQLVSEMVSAFSDDAVKSIFTTVPTKGALLEFFVSTGVGLIVSKVEEATMPTINLDGTGTLSDSYLSGLSSTLWGAGAFTLEVAAKNAVTCAFHQWACSNALGITFVTLKSEVDALASWIYRDATLLFEIVATNRESTAANRRSSSMQRLLTQYADQMDPVWSGAKYWATDSNMSFSLNSEIQFAIQQAKADIPTLLDPLVEEAWRSPITKAHEARLDRAARYWATLEAACREYKSKEGQVGVSKCLNAMKVSPPALLACAADLQLRNGVCVTDGLPFIDTFDGIALDSTKWVVEPLNGRLATYEQSGGQLNVVIAGGSCGYCGTADGARFKPVVPPLSGDFEVTISAEELERKSRDQTQPIGTVQLLLTAGTNELGIYIVGDVTSNQGFRRASR
jgi:hypothetical protein